MSKESVLNIRQLLTKDYKIQHAVNPASSEAAVLIAITEEADPKVVLTLRPEHMKTHAGEVAFAGGKRDAEDLSLDVTVLREAEEEIGLKPSNVELLFTLPQRISLYDLSVTPYIALVPANMTYQENPDEIDSVFEVSLDWLLQKDRQKWKIYPGRGETPLYDYEGFRIFGLTAIILTEFLNLVYDAKLRMPLRRRVRGEKS